MLVPIPLPEARPFIAPEYEQAWREWEARKARRPWWWWLAAGIAVALTSVELWVLYRVAAGHPVMGGLWPALIGR